MSWSRLLSPQRLGKSAKPANESAARNAFQRDYDRIVFSASFRRLHDKTQVFPLPENDHVHTRLTHSIESSVVGRSLGILVGAELKARGELPESMSDRDVGDVVSAACLAHDIGNPPFGHSGEDGIATWFRETGSQYTKELTDKEREDFERFEGNAQGFRLLTRLESPSNRGGLQLTAGTLATFSKYPRETGLPKERRTGMNKKHGFFQSEVELFREVAENTGLIARPIVLEDGTTVTSWSRHPLAYLVEAADDICYRILDLEDGVRLNLVRMERARELLTAVASRDPKFRAWPDKSPGEELSYLRAMAINTLIFEARDVFLANEPALLAGEMEKSLIAQTGGYDILQAITEEDRIRCYNSRDVLEIELAGYEVMGALLSELAFAMFDTKGSGRAKKLLMLLPPPSFALDTPYRKLQRIADYISGMTDSYALTLFRRLKGVTLPGASR